MKKCLENLTKAVFYREAAVVIDGLILYFAIKTSKPFLYIYFLKYKNIFTIGQCFWTILCDDKVNLGVFLLSIRGPKIGHCSVL